MVGIKDEVWAFDSLGCKLRAVFAAAGDVRVGGLPMQILYKSVDNVCCSLVHNIPFLSIKTSVWYHYFRFQ